MKRLLPLLLLLTSCAQVPYTEAPAPNGKVPMIRSLGGYVNVTKPDGTVITTDHRESFSDLMVTVDKATGKILGWKVFNRGVDRLDTRDTIEAASVRDTNAAELAKLEASNQHSLQVIKANNAFELENQIP